MKGIQGYVPLKGFVVLCHHLEGEKGFEVLCHLLEGEKGLRSSTAPGLSLEEFRSSLYNDFNTSEGARRKQQTYCGPFVAMSFNFMISVGIIMANKLVMGKIGFNFPVALSLIHYVTAWFLMAVFRLFSLLPVSPPSKSTPFSSLFLLGAVMSFSTGLSNISLKHNSVGFYQMAKISVTPTIALAEFLFFSKKVTLYKVLALGVVSIGVAVATVTDLEFNLFGASISLAWIVPSAVNKILWSNMQQTGNWTALSATSATSHVVLGQFKTCVIMLGGYLFFNSDPGIVSLCGAIVALSGMSFYTYLNLRASQDSAAATKQLLKQASFPQKTKTTADDEKSDAKVTLDSFLDRDLKEIA
ncbi:putative membrane protein [Dendrobium catenatum]|uniref:Putative membrane protein n=1 Tax=Dendrobium catenatum TaxID=906689 RepID=A0A2I0X358_9ASPA|nr:putative membrane protein [Dendrobium catenatum]